MPTTTIGAGSAQTAAAEDLSDLPKMTDDFGEDFSRCVVARVCEVGIDLRGSASKDGM